ncbi:hypothetical protein BDZ89DRAFT_1115863 [Hymenopellis radicata]|nr:hypothetical protein BDZ89DRAFT_1115863 [Hymenopellis radicata]
MSRKTAGVPLLLESFPEPPSFIPPSPSVAINPPPSRPPASPLPPVPGPSRFSWHDAQRLLGTRDDSISRISMHDLPAADDDDDDDDEAIITSAAAAVSAKRASSVRSWKSTFSDRSSTSSIPTGRSVSPEITDIISRTPRPRRSASTTFSVRSTSTSRPPSSTRRRASSPIGLAYDRSSTFTAASTWEDNFIDDYGELERQLEGEGSDSDSSLDLHTPLPHLMVKQGLLSPKSKLLPKSTSMDSLTSDEGIDPRASTISVDTTKSTKSSILKDSRDTPRRRVRHKDGKLLRGGIGLTTGLGWSDSEDEDAPSPLTRRISSLNLRRAASEAGSEDYQSLRLQSSSSSLASGWRSTMSSGYSVSRPRLSSSSSLSSFHPPRSRNSSTSTSSSYNHPPVTIRGFDKAFQQGLMEEDEIFKAPRAPTSPTSPSVDKDKLLPSLPNPRTGSIRRPSKIQVQADQASRLGVSPVNTLERKRSKSMYTSGAPRALKLPTRAISGTPTTSQRPVPVPRIPLGSTGLKPRTGTGMVYRSSGIAL